MTSTTYIVQKKVTAESIQEALQKEPAAPVTGIFPDTSAPAASADAIGFKHVPVQP